MEIENEYNSDLLATYPDIISVKDLKKILNIGSNTAYDLLNTSKIKSIKVGRIHKIPKINVIRFIEDKQAA